MFGYNGSNCRKKKTDAWETKKKYLHRNNHANFLVENYDDNINRNTVVQTSVDHSNRDEKDQIIWYLDLRASNHLINYKYFTSFEKLSVLVVVGVVKNGTSLHGIKRGTILTSQSINSKISNCY